MGQFGGGDETDKGQGPVSGIVWGDEREMRDKDQ